jgi:hypothetical protein
MYDNKDGLPVMNEEQPKGMITAMMDTHKKRQLYSVILKVMAWFGIAFVMLVLLRSCFA